MQQNKVFKVLSIASEIEGSVSVFLQRALSALLATALCVAAAQADPPAVSRVSTTNLMDPTSFRSAYGSNTGHTTGVAAMSQIPEIQALARTLGATRLSLGQITATQYAQNVYSYVRNNIEVEFRFGLSKGARGALIDQSGTPFDQAELMVKLLRAGGVTANFQTGTITLSAQQAGHWTGLVRDLTTAPNSQTDPYTLAQSFNVDAKALCQFLADGGIPAKVNNSLSCGSLNGNLGSGTPVTVAHVWVVANGQTYDPSFKLHILWPRMNLSQLMGCWSGTASTCGSITDQVVANATQGTFGGQPVLNGWTQGTVAASLLSQAVTLQHGIENIDRSLSTVNVVGGMTIATGGSGTAFASSYTNQGAAWTDIPDQYRTVMTLEANFGSHALFADEIAGRRLVYTGGGTNAAKLTIDNGWVPATCTTSSCMSAQGHILISVDHPYLASNKQYADETVDFDIPEPVIFNDPSTIVDNGSFIAGYGYCLGLNYYVDNGYCDTSTNGSFPITIVHGFGAASTSAEQQVAALDSTAPIDPQMPCNPAASLGGVSTRTCHFGNGPTAAEAVRANYTLLDRIVSGATGAAIIRHHDIGIIYTSRSKAAMYMSLQSAMSDDISRTDDASSRDRAFEISAMLLPQIETAALADPMTPLPMSGPFLGSPEPLVDVAQGHMDNVIAALPPIGNLLVYNQTYETWHRGRLHNNDYTNGWSTVLGLGYRTSAGLMAGEMFYKTDKRAYTFWEGIKGGAGADPLAATMSTAQVSDAASARRHYASVSAADGNLAFQAQPDIVTGAGDFPKSLPFVRSYGGGEIERFHTEDNIFQQTQPPTNASDYVWQSSGADSDMAARLGGGWTHNYAISASMSADAARALGSDNAREAAMVIANVVTLNDLAADTSLKGRARMYSLLNQLPLGYMLLVKKGLSTEPFFYLPDGTFAPPPASKARLTADFPGGASIPYWPDDIKYTGANGDQIYFDYARQYWDGLCGNGGGDSGVHLTPIWKATNWTFPDGTVVTFNYTLQTLWTNIPITTDGCTNFRAFVLDSVQNNLGRSLHFTYSAYGSGFQTILVPPGQGGNPIELPVGYKITDVTDENGRGVHFATPCTTLLCDSFTVTGAAVNAHYEYTPDGNSPDPSLLVRPEYRLRRWYDNKDPSIPYQTFVYDELFRVDSVKDILGHVTQYQSGAIAGTEPWKFAQTVHPLGNADTEIFDLHNNLLQSIDGLGRTTSNIYDNFNRLLQTTFPALNYDTFSYDARSNLLLTTHYPKPQSAEDTAHQTISTATAYEEGVGVFNCANPKVCNKPKTERDARGYYTNYSYKSDNSGLLTQVITGVDASGVCQLVGTTVCPQTNLGYQTFAGTQLLTTKTEKINASATTETDFGYDNTSHHNLQSVIVDKGTGKLNITTNLTFDSIGDLTEVDAINGTTEDTHYVWDTASRRLTMVVKPDPDGSGGNDVRRGTQYVYDNDGQLQETDRGTAASSNGSWVLNVGARELVGYDKAGNKTAVLETGPNASIALNETVYSYDADDRLWCTAVRMNRDSGTHAWGTWDLNACELTAPVSYGLDRITEIIYDQAGQKRQEIRGLGDSALNGGQIYETSDYTANGKLKAVVDADGNLTAGIHNLDDSQAYPHQTNYKYDGFDRLWTTTFADGTTEEIPFNNGSNAAGYDAAGNILSKINRAGQTFQYTYDAVGRMSTKVVPGFMEGKYGQKGSHTISWAYDLLNEVTGVSDSGSISAILNNYDGAKRLTSTARTEQGLSGTQTLTYQYDLDGHRTAMVWPDNYCTLTSYDAAGRAATVKDGTFSGSSCSAPSTLATFGYDLLDHLSDTHYGGNLADVARSVDVNGDLLVMAHNFVTSGDVSFTESNSPAHQVVSTLVNIAGYVNVPVSYTDNYAAANALNQYTSVNGAAPVGFDCKNNPQQFSYDCSGNLTSDGNFTFIYNPENLLVRADSAAVQAAYMYDPLGRRSEKYVAGQGQTYFLLDGDNEVGEYDASGNLQRRFIPGLGVDHPLAMIDHGTKTFFHQDKTGSVVAMSDTSGNVTAGNGPFTYDPYGNPSATTGVPYKFDGMRYDAETGCYYDRARYYCPGIGRFLQTDSVGYQDDVNWYAFVGNDPTDKADPSGNAGVGVDIFIADAEIGYDTPSDRFFIAGRLGFNSNGGPYLDLDPSSIPNAAQNSANNCPSCRISWRTSYGEAGVTAGPYFWQPFSYEGDTDVTTHYPDGSASTSHEVGKGRDIDLGRFGNGWSFFGKAKPGGRKGNPFRSHKHPRMNRIIKIGGGWNVEWGTTFSMQEVFQKMDDTIRRMQDLRCRELKGFDCGM